MSSLLYVAAPFTHSEASVREHWYRTACRVAAILMKSGITVFSPISHSVPIAEYIGEVEDDHNFWMSMDIPILHRCDEVLVLALNGWERSKGVKRELVEAMWLRKPITLIEEADIKRLPAIPKTALKFLKSSIFTEVYDAD